MTLEKKIFTISSEIEFEALALATFRQQYEQVSVYRQFCQLLGKSPSTVTKLEAIPFLPVEFFKDHEVRDDDKISEKIFTSSGTTGSITSKHYVGNLHLYQQSFRKAFEYFYGPISEYALLALLPSYLEREGSSLVYMVDHLIQDTKKLDSGFYLNNLDELITKLHSLERAGEKTLLLGVSYALLDLIEKEQFQLRHTLVMETGGMKGKRKELIKEALHQLLCNGFGVKQIHSEYGMTELLSQAYSKGDGRFHCPPWMKILIRDPEDPLTLVHQKTGGINIIDLANQHSCAFIATQDLGKTHSDDSFEILGRFDTSDIRGCNLMVL